MILVIVRLIKQKRFKPFLKYIDWWRLSNVYWQFVPQMRSSKSKRSFAKLGYRFRLNEIAFICRSECGTTLIGAAWYAVAGDVIWCQIVDSLVHQQGKLIKLTRISSTDEKLKSNGATTVFLPCFTSDSSSTSNIITDKMAVRLTTTCKM